MTVLNGPCGLFDPHRQQSPSPDDDVDRRYVWPDIRRIGEPHNTYVLHRHAAMLHLDVPPRALS